MRVRPPTPAQHILGEAKVMDEIEDPNPRIEELLELCEIRLKLIVTSVETRP
jgi:hypothetical protein